MQREDREHQSRAGVVKHQHACDQTEGGHDRAARNARGADGEDAEQQAEENHRAETRELAVEHLGDRHAEEDLGQHGAAEVDIRKQGDAEIDQVTAQHLALARAVERDGERGGAGHGADSRQVSRAVVAHDLPGALAGVGSGDQIQDRKPDVVAGHDDQDDLHESGQLVGDHALIAQAAEGGADVDGEQGDDDLLNDGQHDVLKLLQQLAGERGLGPDRREAEHQAQGQGAHDGHDLRDVELEDGGLQLAQRLHIRVDGEVGDQRIAGAGAHEGGEDGAEIGQNHGEAEHLRGVVAHAGDGRGDKADDDQRHAEGDELAEDILQGDNDLHGALFKELAEADADGEREDQAKGEVREQLFHFLLLVNRKSARRPETGQRAEAGLLFWKAGACRHQGIRPRRACPACGTCSSYRPQRPAGRRD